MNGQKITCQKCQTHLLTIGVRFMIHYAHSNGDENVINLSTLTLMPHAYKSYEQITALLPANWKSDAFKQIEIE